MGELWLQKHPVEGRHFQASPILFSSSFSYFSFPPQQKRKKNYHPVFFLFFQILFRDAEDHFVLIQSTTRLSIFHFFPTLLKKKALI